MKVWFLVYVLSTGQGSEIHLAIEQPDEDTCLHNLNAFAYPAEVYEGPPLPGEVDVRQPRMVKDKLCDYEVVRST